MSTHLFILFAIYLWLRCRNAAILHFIFSVPDTRWGSWKLNNYLAKRKSNAFAKPIYHWMKRNETKWRTERLFTQRWHFLHYLMKNLQTNCAAVATRVCVCECVHCPEKGKLNTCNGMANRKIILLWWTNEKCKTRKTNTNEKKPKKCPSATRWINENADFQIVPVRHNSKCISFTFFCFLIASSFETWTKKSLKFRFPQIVWILSFWSTKS